MRKQMLHPCFGWEGSIQIVILLFEMLSTGIGLIPACWHRYFSFQSLLSSRIENTTPFSSHITRFASPPPVFCSFIMPSHNSVALSRRHIPLMTGAITSHDREKAERSYFAPANKYFADHSVCKMRQLCYCGNLTYLYKHRKSCNTENSELWKKKSTRGGGKSLRQNPPAQRQRQTTPKWFLYNGESRSKCSCSSWVLLSLTD